jgi:ribosomal protein L44E
MEHFTRNTESILQWCNACRRLTVHPVSDGRVGRCSEHQAKATQAQQRRAAKAERERQNPRLFP